MKNYYIEWDIGQNSPWLLNRIGKKVQQETVWKLRNGNAGASNFSSKKNGKLLSPNGYSIRFIIIGINRNCRASKSHDMIFIGNVHYWITLIFALRVFSWYNMHLRINCLRKILRIIYGKDRIIKQIWSEGIR